MIEVANSDYWKLNVTLESAQMYCFILEIDGKRGWRLPTQLEADSMVNMIYDDHNHDHIDFDDLGEFSEYWSDFDSLGMWTESDVSNNDSEYTSICDVIPVRDI